ncbi:unnamed protein product [Arabidopsis lyrata]|uniref:Predicted protein n=1 Tax=Arabidopsis lyrata subsp. lyrata TaxID=81972 RepID=D7M759_ARALL|nr:uncharacterized protein LOC9309096 [Arabidopsis lyrata subsp. lyrata]EFH49287.1 predicted protein [Arabidopsis lyrata subsp. lyrata]CAH8269741.1 unnamed protein product [Arabidopsis lyrata]|eukprot:XP_002873028.1 uncharacterized protein LOC9309096 [Arabidopsis lyrata subsp. lyrata]
MSDDLENSVINLKLLIDEEKNKVVFAEAGQDFVDILFSFSTLPMGTIVRLLEMHHKSKAIAVGCFNNIYGSVVSMGMKHFSTEACKQMLLYPGSLNQEKCQKIKLKIDDSEATKCFMCPMFVRSGQCSKGYSNFNTSRCSCGNLMDAVIQFQGEGGRGSVGKGVEGGVFVRSGNTSFIITDDLKVEVNSVGSTLKVLKDLGYADCDKLVEMILEVNLQEVATLLVCLFTSDTPLSDTFLKKKSSCGMKRIHKTPSPSLSEDREETKADQTITLNAYVRKEEGSILYVECGEDFVDLLFSFLAMPLESVWEISGRGIILGCIGNLCKSFKDLSVDSGREASAFKCVLPHYYKCQKQLLNEVVTTQQPPTYYRFVSFSVDHFREYCLSENSGKRLVYDWDKLVPVTSIDPKKPEGNDTAESSGFVKRGTKFMVTDDLIITPSNSTSTIGFLKEKQTRLDEVEIRVINMTKEEAIILLGASMVTSSALSTGLLAIESASTSDPQCRFFKKPKIESETET